MYNKVDGRLMQAGDRFEFGRYPQGSNGEEKPITWRVLRRDSDSLLVIADMGLDCKRYNVILDDIRWSNCTLRRWLNSKFYKKSFNEQERHLIRKTKLVNGGDYFTKDNVFLLDYNEAYNLFINDNDRTCIPTEYAVKNGASQYIGHNIAYKGNTWYWLRSCSNDRRGICVNDDGDFKYGEIMVCASGTIRPALCLYI